MGKELRTEGSFESRFPLQIPTVADGYSPSALGTHALTSVLSSCGLRVFLTRSSAVADFPSLAIIKHLSKTDKLLPVTSSVNR